MTYLLNIKRQLIFVGSVFVFFVIIYSFVADDEHVHVVVQDEVIIDVHDTEKFFDEQLFQLGVSTTEKQAESDKHIFGAIVPHHLIPSFIIADIFERIAKQGVETIILLAPNHQNIGSAPVLTSKLAWNTPYGKIMSDNPALGPLIQKDYITVDEKILDEEHAIGGLVPFVAYYNNDVRIVPLILRQNMTREQIEDLSKSIAAVVGDKTVVVASVDFSHYLDSVQAEENDAETLKVMEKKDYDKLLQMNSDYLDSPEAVAILLQTMEQLNIKSSEVLHHTNSGRLMDNPFAQTTSYFGMIFTE